MTRDEFKERVNDFIDSLVDTNRELTEEDETTLGLHFGDVATEVLDEDGDDDEPTEGSVKES
jgi:hypothetical protein